MDSFEALVGHLLEQKGYWVRLCEYIDLTQDERRRWGRHRPRPQIDLVAYKPEHDELILFEVKSFLDSAGVRFNDLKNKKRKDNRYKLLNQPEYQKFVKRKIKKMFRKNGLIRGTTKIKFGLAAGKTQSGDRERVKKFAEQQGWTYLSREEIEAGLRELAKGGFFDSPFSYAAKILARDP